MGITLQKIAGAVLLGLILVIGINKVGDILVPHDKSAATDQAAPAAASKQAAGRLDL